MKSFVLVCFLILFHGAGAFTQDDPIRSIVNVTGELYRFQNNNHYGVFLVTDEGIILADPINAATATWLKGELKARFDKQVKLVIYSHDHADHISGGEIFADTAIFVVHENAALSSWK